MTTNGPPDVTLAFYEDHKSPAPRITTLPWLEFIGYLSDHERTDCVPCPGGKECQKKRGLAFSPAPPRYGETRGDVAVDFVSCLIYDFDHVTEVELEGVSNRVEGLEAVLYSTHSHLWGGPDDNCVRTVISTSRPMKPDEYRVIHRYTRRKFQLEWFRPDKKKLSGADQNAKDLSRLYFMPSAPIGNEVLYAHSPGQPLDVDALLLEATQSDLRGASAPNPLPPKPPSPPRASVAPEPLNGTTLDMHALRECLRAYVPPPKDEDDEEITRKELIRRVVYEEPLVRDEEVSISRDRTVHRVAKIMATKALPDGTPKEAAIELVRASIMSMRYDGDGADGSNSIEARFKKFEYSWERGLVTREEHKQKIATQHAQNVEFQRRLHQRLKSQERSAARAAATTPEEIEAIDASAEDDEDDPEDSNAPFDSEGWELLLKWIYTKDKRVLQSCDFNVIHLLSYLPEWRHVIRFNEVTKDVILVGGPLLPHQKKPEQVTVGIKSWMQSNKDISLNTKDTMTSISHVAQSNAFDPVSDYLNVVQPRWDLKPRANTFLEVYVGAQTSIDEGENEEGKKEAAKDITPYIQLVGRRWLIGTVARGLNPGCKMDNVLILEGDQGIKKSTLLAILGGEWFADSQINITDKDSKMLAARSWIVEMPELSALRANETESQKAFFSSRVDKFRPPYGYAIQEFPRRCVFVGSTNDDQYMHDITGNRRYWPVRCDGVKPKLVKRDRDQIWAEAVTIYKAGGKNCHRCQEALDGEDRCPEHRWWFSAAENKTLLEDVNKARLKSDFADAIVDFVLRFSKERRPKSFTTNQIALDGLKIPADRVVAHQGSIGRALRVLGFEKKRVKEHGVLSWKHFTPKNLLEASTRAGGGLNPKTGAPEPQTNGVRN